MGDAFQIRDYRERDYPAIERLWSLTGLGGSHRGDDATVIERTLAQGGVFLIMEAISNAELIGTSWMTCDGRRVYLHHFGIAPEWQRRGLGKALLKASLDRARAIGLQTKLEVYRDNKAAIALYQSQGFRYLGDYDSYIIRDFGSLS